MTSGTMRGGRWVWVATALAALGLSGVAGAQDRTWQSFVSISPVFESGNLDSGGDFDVGGVIARVGTSTGFGNGHRGGVTLNFDYFDYSFDNPVAFGGVAPWKILKRYGASAPFTFSAGDGWTVGVAPSVDWFREDGANGSDSLVWGATFSAMKRFGEEKFLGLGLAAFDGIEETRFFPFPIVNWRFNRNWRLVNPLAAGPTGPAGLELNYLLDDRWTLGLGGAWRRARYRLSEIGPVANGIGEIRGAPVYLRARRELGGGSALNLYAGVVVGGEFRVEDPNGNLLQKEEFDISPIIGANITARF